MSSAHQETRPFGLGIELLNRIDYRLAETEADKEAIYRLRYRAYLNEAAVEPNSAQKVTDRFDELPNSWVFGVYFEGVLASSIRISVASPEHPDTPSVTVFADVLEPMLAQGKVMIDPTRFVADPDRAKRLPELPYVTLRLAYVATSYFNADVGLAAVRAEHQAFYRRFFMHRLWSPPRPFAGLLKPICLMAVDDPAVRDKVYARFPYLVSSAAEQRMLFTRSTEREHHPAPADRVASPCQHP
jgi:Autoinducer synthase